jgi:catechol 2,3-dioxygenase-like lactoylglutathione lyase family enzyme
LTPHKAKIAIFGQALSKIEKNGCAMSVQLNHTIVHVKNKKESAVFFSEILGLPPAVPFHHFLVLKTANSVSLDFLDSVEEIQSQHYAFLVTEEEFDQIFDRIQKRALPYWADPAATMPNEINRRDGGRGCYFEDPSGHYLEILTVPYGGWNR